jgi:hypothetical protein
LRRIAADAVLGERALEAGTSHATASLGPTGALTRRIGAMMWRARFGRRTGQNFQFGLPFNVTLRELDPEELIPAVEVIRAHRGAVTG